MDRVVHNDYLSYDMVKKSVIKRLVWRNKVEQVVDKTRIDIQQATPAIQRENGIVKELFTITHSIKYYETQLFFL